MYTISMQWNPETRVLGHLKNSMYRHGSKRADASPESTEKNRWIKTLINKVKIPSEEEIKFPTLYLGWFTEIESTFSFFFSGSLNSISI